MSAVQNFSMYSWKAESIGAKVDSSLFIDTVLTFTSSAVQSGEKDLMKKIIIQIQYGSVFVFISQPSTTSLYRNKLKFTVIMHFYCEFHRVVPFHSDFPYMA